MCNKNCFRSLILWAFGRMILRIESKPITTCEVEWVRHRDHTFTLRIERRNLDLHGSIIVKCEVKNESHIMIRIMNKDQEGSRCPWSRWFNLCFLSKRERFDNNIYSFYDYYINSNLDSHVFTGRRNTLAICLFSCLPARTHGFLVGSWSYSCAELLVMTSPT